jgi:hypothetical protein
MGSGGSFTASFVVGNVGPGTYLIQVQSGSAYLSVYFVVVAPFIQLSDPLAVGQPASGPIGTHVTIVGSYFSSSDTTCSVSGPSNGNLILNGACAFFAGTGIFTGYDNVTGSFEVGNLAEGQYVVQVSGNQGDFAQAVFNVTAGAFIQLSGVSGGFTRVGQPASGPIGTHVSIEGSQFLSGDAFNSATCSIGSPTSGTVIQNGACSFFKTTSGWVNVTGSFVVGNVPEGQYVVQVSGSQGDSAEAIMNVTAGAFIQLSGVSGGFVKVGQVASGPTGTHVSIEGSQFLSNDAFNSATCSLGSPTSGSIIVDGACSFFKTSTGWVNVTGSFIAGNVNPGQYVIQVSGSAGDSAQAVFYVSSGPFIQLTGTISGYVSLGQTASGRIGTHVAIEGTNFLITDTSCSISSPTGSIITAAACSTFTANNGFKNVTGSFTVGSVTPGQYVIQVSGNQGDFAQAVFNVTIGPTITLSPITGRTGTHVTVTGTGFLPTDNTCTLSGPGSGIMTAQACSIVLGSGTISGSFTAGNVLSGQYLIQVSGSPGGDFGTAIFNVTVGPSITQSPATARAGAHVTVNGTGFLPTDTLCTISSPGSSAVLTGTQACAIQSGTGVTGGSYTIGNVLPGEYVIQVTGNQGDFAQTVLNVTSGPSLTLNPATGTIGTSILVNGTGFLPTDQSCSISALSGTGLSNPILTGSAACVVTVGTGIVRGSFIIASVAPGEYTIEVTGCVGNNGCSPSVGDFAQDVLTVTSIATSLTLFPTSAVNGATVTFSAYGLSASDTGCVVESVVETSPGVYTSNTILVTSPTCSVVSSQTAKGSFVVGPYATTDINWTVQVRGTPVNDIPARAAFNVTASIVVTPTTGTINSVFTFTGSGFSSKATSCDATVIPPFVAGSPFHPSCYLSATIGQVSGSLTVPTTATSGTYGIDVGDYLGHNSTGFFTVGTPSALLVLTPASVGQSQPVGFAATGLNPSDVSCVINSGTAPWAVTPTCLVSGGYASGSFTVSPTAAGGYYLITVTGCTTSTCSEGAGDFAQNFLAVTLSSTITTFSSTTSTTTTTTSYSTTTSSVATNVLYTTTTEQTTGILFTTYSHLTVTTASGQTTTTLSQTTSTTQTQTTVTVTTTTAFTTVTSGYMVSPVQPAQIINPSPSPDIGGLLAALLLILPILIRRLFS